MITEFIGIIFVFVLVLFTFSYLRILPIFTDKSKKLYDEYDVVFVTVIFFFLLVAISTIFILLILMSI